MFTILLNSSLCCAALFACSVVIPNKRPCEESSCQQCKFDIFSESYIFFSTHVSSPFKILYGDKIYDGHSLHYSRDVCYSYNLKVSYL